MKKIMSGKMDSDLILESETKSNMWSIRPCHVYKGELQEVFPSTQIKSKISFDFQTNIVNASPLKADFM